MQKIEKMKEKLITSYYNLFHTTETQNIHSLIKQAFFYLSKAVTLIIFAILLFLLWLISCISPLFNANQIKNLLKTSKKRLRRKLSQRQSSSKLKIFLDLDNTLVYTTDKKILHSENFFKLDDKYYVYKRPFLDNFLETLSKFSELTLYTSSKKEYADKIINIIDKDNYINEKYYRENCILINNSYFKNVKQYEIKNQNILIIDDNPDCHLNMKNNIIKIKNWNGDETDDSLFKITNTLKNYNSHGRVNIDNIINSLFMSDV